MLRPYQPRLPTCGGAGMCHMCHPSLCRPKVPSGSKSLFDGGCFTFTAAEIAAFPNVTLGITDKGLQMPPSSYLRAADPRAKVRRRPL